MTALFLVMGVTYIVLSICCEIVCLDGRTDVVVGVVEMSCKPHKTAICRNP